MHVTPSVAKERQVGKGVAHGCLISLISMSAPAGGVHS